MKVPFEMARAFPKLNMILLAFGEELPKFFKDSCGVDLVWMQLCIEYLLGRVDGVGDNNDFRYVFFFVGLVKSTPNREKFHFSAGDEGHMINHLDKGFVIHVNM